MVKKMKEAGVPIDGIGMQGHYNIYFPDEEKLEKAINRFSEIVNTIHITELDLRTNTESGGQLMFSRGEAKPQPGYMQTLQEDQYARLFKIFRKHKDVIKNVTFWNLSDKSSFGLRLSIAASKSRIICSERLALKFSSKGSGWLFTPSQESLSLRFQNVTFLITSLCLRKILNKRAY